MFDSAHSQADRDAYQAMTDVWDSISTAAQRDRVASILKMIAADAHAEIVRAHYCPSNGSIRIVESDGMSQLATYIHRDGGYETAKAAKAKRIAA